MESHPRSPRAPRSACEGQSLKRSTRPLKVDALFRIDAFSLLVLNKEIVQDHPTVWTEDDIKARSKHISEEIAAVWPGPMMDVQESAFEVARS